MPHSTTTQSLQDLLDTTPDLTDYFYNDTRSPAFNAPGAASASFTPPAYTNWRDEQRAWSETAVLFEQTHNMPELFLTGPDAVKLLKRLGVNSFENFGTDRAKQFIACSPSGHLIGDSILYRHGEESFELVSGMPALDWVHYHADTGGYDVEVVRDNQSIDNASGRRERFRLQLDGPNAGQILAAAIESEPPTLPFFHTAEVVISGKAVLVLRHGMAGHQGVELSGAFDDHDAVRSTLLTVGEEWGITPAGTLAYYSSPMSSGWMPYPVPGIFTGHDTRGFREWLPATSWEANVNLSGSYRSSLIEDYYSTPYDRGYGRTVKFDHDFIGREALEGIEPDTSRVKRTLVWNREDVLRVFGSQFGEGPRFKAIELPVSYYGLNPFDAVRDSSGRDAGVSCHSGYSSGELVSLAMLYPGHAELGTELVLTWGEPDGGSRKPHVERHEQTEVRVTVGDVPFTGTVQRMMRAGLKTGS